MFQIQVPIGLSLMLALGAGSVWTARLDGREGSKMSGTAQVESPVVMPPSDSVPADSTKAAAPALNELRVTVTLSNAPANASLSWYLYSGTCTAASAGDADSIIGVPSSYGPIPVDGSGNGKVVTVVRAAQVGTGGSYYVGVLSGGKLAACGNLEPQASTGQ